MPPAVTKVELLDRLMGGKLREYVLGRRDTGRSWAGISADIRADYDVDFSDERLRLIFGDEQAAS
jgi:hypothetical protein